jgi:hypothetical protein
LKVPDDVRFKRGLLQWKHIERLGGSPFWLYLFYIDRQTHPNGLVWYGRPISYRWICREMGGAPERTLKRWHAHLRDEDYIAVKQKRHQGMVVRVLRPKKYSLQMSLFGPQLVPVEKPVEKLSIVQIHAGPLLAPHKYKKWPYKDTGKERTKR